MPFGTKPKCICTGADENGFGDNPSCPLGKAVGNHPPAQQADLRECEHCGCRTNAKIRRCCEHGYLDDSKKPKVFSPPQSTSIKVPPGRGRAVTESMQKHAVTWLTETIKLELPKRPTDQWGKELNPRLPWDITKIDDQELGMLHGQFTAMYQYGIAQLGLVDVDYTEGKYLADLEEAKAGLRAEGDNAQQRKLNAQTDPRYVEFEAMRADRTARRALLSRVVDGYLEAKNCLSREMTRRGLRE